MNRPLFVANWKMHMTRAEAASYTRELGTLVAEAPRTFDLVLAPPFTALDAARDPKERWSLAGQNCASEERGAFTGEISAQMLSDAGCRYVVIGHSERRRLFGETPELLARKLSRARQHGLVPIFCVGETAEERAAGATAAVLSRQLASLSEDPPDAALVVAYEPVWAIGTGNAATPADARDAGRELEERLSTRRDLRLLYGGSVAPDNSAELLRGSEMDGFLIGGASLRPESFAAIAGVSRP